jgi:methylase of polypeptide subunit release factors
LGAEKTAWYKEGWVMEARVNVDDHGALEALVELGRALATDGYRFVTVTPGTHERVNGREDGRPGRTLRDIFGWSRPFEAGALPARYRDLLAAAGALVSEGALHRSAVRFSSVDERLYVHSAHPTVQADAVFFGPDTYRFITLLKTVVPATGRLVDVGCGTGAGGLEVADRCRELVLADISPRALAMAAVNCRLAGRPAVARVVSDVLAGVAGPIDCVISNPPYLSDDQGRVYRDGGGPLGFDLSVRLTREALARLSPGGTFVLYTGSPIIEGRDPLRAALEPLLQASGARYRTFEIDPDVFGEELDRPVYRQADRLAVIAVVAQLPSSPR